jgi:hypothetical protein
MITTRDHGCSRSPYDYDPRSLIADHDYDPRSRPWLVHWYIHLAQAYRNVAKRRNVRKIVKLPNMGKARLVAALYPQP